jgi:ABC-type multidrug transport system ATPase subunit
LNIRFDHTGKRYQRQWIFRGLSEEFVTGDAVALLGYNGSGKSTLLQVVAGFLTPSEGQVFWSLSRSVPADEVHRHVSWCAPSIQLYDAFTLRESIRFHGHFRNWRRGITAADLPGIMGLETQQDKPLSQYSSGMKQRVKLGLAILSDTPILLLDEPTSHLDDLSTQWFMDLLSGQLDGRITWIASNRVETETSLCNRILRITDYK